MALVQPQLPFVGYEPHESGGILFHKPDGTSVLTANDPHAAWLAGAIDRYNASQPDQRTAMVEPAVAPMGGVTRDDILAMNGADMARQLTAPPPAAHDAMAIPAVAPVGPPPNDPRNLAMPIAYGAHPPPPRVAAAEHERPEVSNEPAPPEALAALPGAPTAPRSPTGAEPIQFAPGGAPSGGGRPRMMPHSESMTIEGGIQDPEARAQLMRDAAEQRDVENHVFVSQLQAANADMDQGRAQALQAQTDIQRLQDEQAKAAAKQQFIKGEFQKRQAIALKEADRQAKREVDPGRIWAGKPGAQLMGLIGVALGAFGQAFSGSGRNEALEQLNRKVDQDIDAQRDEIQRGNIAANNNVARLRDQYGLDTDEATNLAKSIADQQTLARARQMAAMQNTAAARDRFLQIQNAMAQRQMGRDVDLQNTIGGKIKTVVESKVSGGGSGLTPLQIQARDTHLKRQIAEDTSTIEHGGKAPGKQGEGSGKIDAGAAASAKMAQDLAPRLGLTQDPNTGEFHPASGADSHTGRFNRAVQYGKEALGFGQDREEAIESAARELSRAGRQGHIDETQYQRNLKRLRAANSDEQFARTYTDLAKAQQYRAEASAGGDYGGGGGETGSEDTGASHGEEDTE